MTDTTTATMRVYTRAAAELEQTVTVNIDANGYIRMRADNLDGVLRQLGFRDTKEPTT
jgi:hypothetical protein